MKSSEQQIADFLTRSVENIYPKREMLQAALEKGEKIRVYMGIDPTGPTLHIGHAIPLKKLGELQKMGHEVIMLIGDFTAMIGDPTDKSATRKQLTREEVLTNCENYKAQASHLLDFEGENPAKLLFNSEWLGKMSFADVVELASHFTVQQMMERDMFERRLSWKTICPHCGHKVVYPSRLGKKEFSLMKTIEKNQLTSLCENCKKQFNPQAKDILPPDPVYLHEFMYPLMQGFDSVAMEVNLEIGGNDQTFNMLAGRTLMKEMSGKEKMVLTTKLLADQTGKKMGKSEGNMVALSDSPEDMYGKVMSWTDGMIMNGFELCTDLSLEEIKDIGNAMLAGENPVKFKHKLAFEIVKAFLGEDAANAARAHFDLVHKSGEMPEEIPEYQMDSGATLADILVGAKLVTSKSDARRQIEQGGVKVDGVVVNDIQAVVNPGSVIQKGKRFFVKVT